MKTLKVKYLYSIILIFIPIVINAHTNWHYKNTSLMPIPPDTQNINLSSGWSLISTYIDPFEPNVDSVFNNIQSQVIVMKNAMGDFYWPFYGVNLIGDMTIGSAYYIRMLSSQILSIYGDAIIPENTPVIINQGWTIVGYLRQNPGPIEIMLAPILNDVIIVKDGDGNVLWPYFNLNMINYMIPGEGYSIKMNSQQTLTYPAN